MRVVLLLVACAGGTAHVPPPPPPPPDAAPTPDAPPPPPGTLTGVVIGAAPADDPCAGPAVVLVDGLAAGGSPAELRFQPCGLGPSPLLAVGSLAVASADPRRHALAGALEGDRLVPLPLEGGRYELPALGPGLHRVGCAEHPGESAWIAVGGGATVDGEGRFTVAGVAAGKRCVTVVTSDGRQGAVLVDVPAGGAAEVTLTIGAGSCE